MERGPEVKEVYQLGPEERAFIGQPVDLRLVLQQDVCI